METIELTLNMNGENGLVLSGSWKLLIHSENVDRPAGMVDKFTALITDKNLPLFAPTHFHS